MQDSKDKSIFSGTLTQLFAAISGKYIIILFFLSVFKYHRLMLGLFKEVTSEIVEV